MISFLAQSQGSQEFFSRMINYFWGLLGILGCFSTLSPFPSHSWDSQLKAFDVLHWVWWDLTNLRHFFHVWGMMDLLGVIRTTQSTAGCCLCWGTQNGGDLSGVQDSLCLPQWAGECRDRSHSALGDKKGARAGPRAFRHSFINQRNSLDQLENRN